jgi:hypothetical protein
MKHVRIMPGDRLRLGRALERRNLCQKKFSVAFGGECRLCVRRCISPPVMTSMAAIS